MAATAKRQRLGIGVAHVFTGEDHKATSEKTHVLAPFQHPRQPVQTRVGIASADALDQCAGRVVVRVAELVVRHRLALHAFGGQLARELQWPLLGAEHADFQSAERARASPSLTSARNSRASSCK